MALVFYWTVKILAWTGIVFSLYSVVQPKLMLALFIKSFQWKMKWFGLQGTLEATPSAQNLARGWSIVMALIFLGINYIFGNVIAIGYVLE